MDLRARLHGTGATAAPATGVFARPTPPRSGKVRGFLGRSARDHALHLETERVGARAALDLEDEVRAERASAVGGRAAVLGNERAVGLLVAAFDRAGIDEVVDREHVVPVLLPRRHLGLGEGREAIVPSRRAVGDLAGTAVDVDEPGIVPLQ